MMINFHGRTTKAKREAITAAFEWVAYTLMDTKIAAELEIDLYYKKYDDNNMGNDLAGSCLVIDEDPKPWLFEVFINNTLSDEDTLQAIFHEMVHVRQYAMGQLSENLMHHTWKKKKFCKIWTTYMDRPWEKEAYKLEKVLYAQYMKEMK